MQSACARLWWESLICCERRSCLHPGRAGSCCLGGRWGWRLMGQVQGPNVTQTFSSTQWSLLPYLGCDWVLRYWSRSLVVGSKLGSIPSQCAFSRSWKGQLHPEEKLESTGARDVGAGHGCGPRTWGPLEKLSRALGISVCFICLVPRCRHGCARVLFREWSLNFFEVSCK